MNTQGSVILRPAVATGAQTAAPQPPLSKATSTPPASDPVDSMAPLTPVIFATDFDGTANDPQDPQARFLLFQGLEDTKKEFRKYGIDLRWGVVSARDPVGMASLGLPANVDFNITLNGGDIQIGPPGTMQNGQFVPTPIVQPWHDINAAYGFNKGQVIKVMDGLLSEKKYQNLTYQTVGQACHVPTADSSPFAVTPCFDQTHIQLTPAEQKDKNHDNIPDDLEKTTYRTPQQMHSFMRDLSARMTAAHLPAILSPAYPFMGLPLVMFDITTPTSRKGDAVDYLAAHAQELLHTDAPVTPDHIIVAGDGGNDESMTRAKDGSDDGRRVIVVSGERDLYESVKDLKHVIMEPATETSSLGVLDGVRRQLFQIVAEMQAQAASGTQSSSPQPTALVVPAHIPAATFASRPTA